MEKRRELDEEFLKSIVKRANRLTFIHTLNMAKNMDDKLESMRNLARCGVLQNMDREEMDEKTLEFIDKIIEEYRQSAIISPGNDWD